MFCCPSPHIRRLRDRAALAHAQEAVFGVAAAAPLLVFTGIHNAWDAVTYHVFFNRGRKVNERPR